MLELELVLVLQIHKLAAGALGSIDTTKREKIKDRGMEALCPPPRRNALFCLYLVHVTKGAESDEQELLARMRVRSRTRGCMRRRTDGADAGRQALLASRLAGLKA